MYQTVASQCGSSVRIKSRLQPLNATGLQQHHIKSARWRLSQARFDVVLLESGGIEWLQAAFDAY